MTPTKAWTVELFDSSLRVDAGEVLARVLVYTEEVGYEARITFDGGVREARVVEASEGPEHGYVACAPDAARDEAVRRICDCDDDLIEALSTYLADYEAWCIDEETYAAGGHHCPGCSVCLGVPSYAGF